MNKPIAYALSFCMSASLLTACREGVFDGAENTEPSVQSHLTPAPADLSKFTVRKTLYVPVYSHIYHEDLRSTLDLAATLSVRNTDFKQQAVLKSVRYYSTEGTMLKEFVPSAVSLGPMATADFVIPRTDTTGGSGANFIVEWQSPEDTSPVLAECVMISAGSSHSVSFTSRGTEIANDALPAKSSTTNGTTK
jgi:hypothetical protein